MSFSANKRNKSVSNKDIEKDNNKQKLNLSHKKTYSPTNNIYNLKLIPSYETVSTKNTNLNISSFKEKDNAYYSYPIKPLNEDDLENYFFKKKQKIFRAPTIINDKKISFQRQKDKAILEFSLFDDNLIFKDINRAYLEDEHDDDGDESSEETINNGKLYLSQEVQESTKELQKNLKNNQKIPILSRKMRFKNDDDK